MSTKQIIVSVPPVPITGEGEEVNEAGEVVVEVWLPTVPPLPEILEGEEEFPHVLPLASSFTM